MTRFPPWLKKPLCNLKTIAETKEKIARFGLHTVCEEASCPNRGECFSKKKATFLLLGPSCTRACGFCGVSFSETPELPDESEPKKIAQACKELGLQHVVLTMVTRDDLVDGGATHVASTITEVTNNLPHSICEALVSDFQGKSSSIETVLNATPFIFGHNIETVRRLSPKIRCQATYERSLEVLAEVKRICPTQQTKSGFMVGLGESFDEISKTLKDLADVSVDIVTVGQYLQPTPKHIPVKSFVTLEQFQKIELEAKRLGIKKINAGPFIRSSS
jgi:lipoyl synthase